MPIDTEMKIVKISEAVMEKITSFLLSIMIDSVSEGKKNLYFY